uniref:Uncharacterized protein n=1 Tax=Anguilla anguilla TaxID=7936 RepID=A0A0E9WDK7_ANGAN
MDSSDITSTADTRWTREEEAALIHAICLLLLSSSKQTWRDTRGSRMRSISLASPKYNGTYLFRRCL